MFAREAKFWKSNKKIDCGANTCVKYGLDFAFYCGFTVCHFGDFAFSRVLRAVAQKVAFWLKTAPPRQNGPFCKGKLTRKSSPRKVGNCFLFKAQPDKIVSFTRVLPWGPQEYAVSLRFKPVSYKICILAAV